MQRLVRRFRGSLRNSLTGAFALLALAAPTFADTLTVGFQSGTPHSVGAFDAYATLPSGDRVVFDGIDVDLVDEAGALILHLGSLPNFQFPSIVVIDPSNTFAVVGESADVGSIYKVDLAGGGMSPLTAIDFNYDAV